MPTKEITIGVPSGEYFTICRDTFLCFSKMLKYTYENQVSKKVNLIFSASPMTSRNRNAILKGKGDYVFMVDADMTFPPDTIERMIKASILRPDCVIVGTAYMGSSPYFPVLFKWDDKSATATPFASWPEDEPFEVDCAGSFGMLIPRSIIDKVGENAFDHVFLVNPTNPSQTKEIRHDFAFCNRVRQAGFKILCLPDLEFGHIRPYPITGFDWQQMQAANQEAKDEEAKTEEKDLEK